jgi:N-dimethylarginine dimethylaminohydrolase
MTTETAPAPTAERLAFGGQSNIAPLKDALLKAPGPAFGRAFEVPGCGFFHPVDLELAKREHAAFADLLTKLGTRVHFLDAEVDSPDLLYAYDPLIITDRGAIPLRPGKRTRQVEPAAIEAWTLAHGIPTIGRIEAPGTIEGGDTFWLRADLFLIGRTLRTNDEGARQLAALVGGDVRVFDVPYYRGNADLVHLMSIIHPIADDLAVVRLPLLPVGLYQLLMDMRYRLIEVPDEEFDTLGSNVLVVRPGVVVAAAGNPVVARGLTKAGVEVHTYAATEIGINGSGGPTCMTRPILREVA